MIISAMQTDHVIEMCVIDSHYRDQYSSIMHNDKRLDMHHVSSGNSNSNNNNNNNNSRATKRHSLGTTLVSDDDVIDMNGSLSTFDSVKPNKTALSYPNLNAPTRRLETISNTNLSRSVLGLRTGSNES